MTTQSSSAVPAHYQLVYSEKQIQVQVERIGREITAWYKKNGGGEDIIAIPVMRGGIYFFSDLTRKIQLSVSIAPGRARAYVENKYATTRSEVAISLDGVSVAGRDVLLIDDLCDSGRTLDTLVAYLNAQGAESVRSAVLIQRKSASAQFKPDWAGFEFDGDSWFFGYGLDDKGRFSNLPDVYTTKV